METTTNTNSNHLTTFRAVRGTSLEQEETASLWVGRLPKGCTDPAKRRDVVLSQPLPIIGTDEIQQLAITHPQQLADLVSDSFSDYLRRVKVARLDFGSSYQVAIPAAAAERALYMLTVITEGSRERKELSGSTVRELVNSDQFKAAAAARCQQAGISTDAFKRVVIDGFLRACTREDFGIFAGQEATRDKAAAHLRAILAVMPTSRTLELAVNRIAAAAVQEEGI